MKRCSKCGATKPLDAFHRCSRSKNGRASACRECRNSEARNTERTAALRERQRVTVQHYRERNRELIRQRSRDAYAANAEHHREVARAWREANPEAHRAAVKRWREANREVVLAKRRAWREANAERHREATRQWFKDNPVKARDYVAARRAKKGRASPETSEYMAFLLTQPCAYCGGADNIVIDHIVPLARGGCHEPSNLAAACAWCNGSKGAKLLSEWPGPPESSSSG